jgi:hypothetical protein
MSTQLSIPDEELVEIPSPHVEPRLAFLARSRGYKRRHHDEEGEESPPRSE